MNELVTEEHHEVWACHDCTHYLVNASIPERFTTQEEAEAFKADVTTGLMGGHATPGKDHNEFCCDGEDADVEACNTQDFGIYACNICGSDLAGVRHAMTLWVPCNPHYDNNVDDYAHYAYDGPDNQ